MSDHVPLRPSQAAHASDGSPAVRIHGAGTPDALSYRQLCEHRMMHASATPKFAKNLGNWRLPVYGRSDSIFRIRNSRSHLMPQTTARSQKTYAKRAQQLPALVRRLRQQIDVTLGELAARSGISPATLSKIENGRLSPGYDTLMKLADGLGVDVAALFDAPSTAEGSTGRRSITRRGKGRVHETPQYRYEMFCAELVHRQFTPLLTTITARSVQEFGHLTRHRGEEFLYVLSGEIELHTEQYEPARLRSGDGCYFDSRMGHACISVSKDDALVLWIASNADGLHASNARDR